MKIKLEKGEQVEIEFELDHPKSVQHYIGVMTIKRNNDGNISYNTMFKTQEEVKQ